MKAELESPNSVWITDAAVVTALGNNLSELWGNLLSGLTAIRPVRRFPVQCYNSQIAACIEELMHSDGSSMFHSLLDLLFIQIGQIPSDAMLITASTKAGIDNLELSCRGKESESRDILLSSVPDTVSKRLGLAHKGINISAACASSTIAIAQAAEWIVSGRADAVVVCCLDLVTEFVFSGFSCLRALSSEPCKPFDRDRNGLSLGEGAAFLLLISHKRAVHEQRNLLGSIAGWGAANDAAHITAPARDGSGLIAAIRQALTKAAIQPEMISAINAHGTGTVYNDMMELTAFHGVFGDCKIPIHSIKGSIGHTLGAAGGIEAAVGLKSLSTGMIPPSVGLSIPEQGAQGVISNKFIEISGDYLLTTNSGFGGINAAIILRKGR